jgi:6-phosphogluconolactonase (cycloisomerase 2 family)
VTELTGSGLVLQNNGGDDLAISASGTFAFALPVVSGSDYAVTVKTQPSGPAQICSVGGGINGDGTGTVGDANVENVRVSCGLHFAYATNAGDDTISAYAIAAFTGALTPVGTPVATGTSPYTITGSPDKRHVYVVNRTSNDIWAYAVDAVSGALTPTPGSPIATGTDPQALAFDPSGAYLYVANNGSDDLSAFSVNASTGELTPLSPATYATGTGPSAVSVDDSGKFVFVANNGGSNNISVFAISGGTGALTEVAGSPFPADGNPRSLAISPTYGTYLYSANVDGANSSISGFSVNLSTGGLTKLTGSPFPLEVSNYIGIYKEYGDYLFVTTVAGVAGYFASGPLTTVPICSAVAGSNAYSVTIDQMNSVLYVANDGAASISAYKIEVFCDSLTEVPGSPFPAGTNPNFIAIL